MSDEDPVPHAVERARLDRLNAELGRLALVADGLQAERDALAATVARVRDLHRPFNIYDECEHKHTDEDVAAGRAVDIRDVGVTCQDGLMYVVCTECCTNSGYQTEYCADYHDHVEPICSTIAALDAPGDQP